MLLPVYIVQHYVSEWKNVAVFGTLAAANAYITQHATDETHYRTQKWERR